MPKGSRKRQQSTAAVDDVSPSKDKQDEDYQILSPPPNNNFLLTPLKMENAESLMSPIK